ncbi:hypothetical protein ACLVWU_03200 [Bdellovibrio sp. HCB290]|uniref:hypothetical protein n=1 Tax=Bdellovibrio sp. HCB290 TaxID=3394356 RepID=UPI0039B62E27
MKYLISILIILASTQSIAAGKTCMAVYAAGLGYFLNENGVQLGDKAEFTTGQSTQDERYKVSLKEDGTVSLLHIKGNFELPLALTFNDGSVTIYQSEDQALYPENVPGARIGTSFIYVGCAQEP